MVEFEVFCKESFNVIFLLVREFIMLMLIDEIFLYLVFGLESIDVKESYEKFVKRIDFVIVFDYCDGYGIVVF